MGGFGRVFEHSVSTGTKVAVKEEAKPVSNYSTYVAILCNCIVWNFQLQLSLISNLKRFTSLLDLNHPNVLHFQEYIIGQ